MRRGIAAVALAAAVTVSASACSSDSGSGTASSGPVTITWWDTSDATNEAGTFKTLVADFEKANPDVKVTYVNVPFADAQSKFQTAAGSKGAPDVLRADVGWTAGFVKSGFLAPLDGTPAAADAAEFEPALIEQAKVDGKLYGLPQVTDTLALMYNKDLFAKAGITAAPATWDELKADAALVKDRTGVDGFAFNPQGYYAMPFLYGEGTDMIDASAKKITVNSPAAVTGIDTVKSLVSAPGVMKLDTTSNGYANIMDAFGNGKVAAIIQGPWESANVFKGSSFQNNANLGIATVPAGSAGKAGAPLGGHNLVAYAGSDAAHQAAAQKFIAFMTSADSQVLTATKNSTLPTRTDAYTADVTRNVAIAGYQQVLSSGRPRPAVAQYSSLYDPFGTELIKILSGQESTKAGLDNVAASAKKLLPDYASQ
ncbi:extracellular solute-binding protein [Kitasatospora sp. NA04385]|uniref:extracellular solute-binding protein n=1 Tax=Kitasatospora sp. NA04385 TaxID=2742135 RepID=UPI00159262C1|nr:extracellular solute-binding protein [Kitasatospora sp. NA04385]QKW22672.1 extracellular solute-binding protein [Kitasatospora sp. NA04385]